jgi:hypothetical protein
MAFVCDNCGNAVELSDGRDGGAPGDGAWVDDGEIGIVARGWREECFRT